MVHAQDSTDLGAAACAGAPAVADQRPAESPESVESVLGRLSREVTEVRLKVDELMDVLESIDVAVARGAASERAPATGPGRRWVRGRP